MMIFIILLLVAYNPATACGTATDPNQLNFSCINESVIHNRKLKIRQDFLEEKSSLLLKRLNSNNLSEKRQLSLLLELLKLDLAIGREKEIARVERLSFRYRKGLEVIKMIFEKLLALDHHFTSLRTYQDVLALSNPNSYPEFLNFKKGIKSELKSRQRAELPVILENNSLFSMGYTLLYSVLGKNDRVQRENDIDRISCLLDFSLSMQSDLKLIFFETDYLRMENEGLKSDCLILFNNYLKILAYSQGLEYCRSNDDWDAIYKRLDQKTLSIIHNIETSKINSAESSGDYGDLSFSLDLLLNFIASYSEFIRQGELYYRKFLSIVRSYANNNSKCLDSLPVQYKSLESEMEQSIEKFERAYGIAELKGSKLKEILYGAPLN